MLKRISPSTLIACLALFFSLTGAGLAHAQTEPGSHCAMRSTVQAGRSVVMDFRCSRIHDPVVHVYVNHHEVLFADQLAVTATSSSAVWYGDQTIVRVTQRHNFDYRISVATLLPHAVVWTRLKRS